MLRSTERGGVPAAEGGARLLPRCWAAGPRWAPPHAPDTEPGAWGRGERGARAQTREATWDSGLTVNGGGCLAGHEAPKG